MDFPYSIISDQYDLFMNKIIQEMLPINSYNQFKSVKQLQSIRQSCAHHCSFMLPSSKFYLIKLLGYTVYSGNFSFPCVNSAIQKLISQITESFMNLLVIQKK